MNIQKFVFDYDGNAIEFTKNGNVMVNATQMAKLFGKEIKDFMRNEQTKLFINECLKTENSPFLNVNSENDLYTSSQKTGTFMHRVLALKFAAWLSPSFEFWVFRTIDQILNGNTESLRQDEEKRFYLNQELKDIDSNISALTLRKKEIYKEKEELNKRIAKTLNLFALPLDVPETAFHLN